MSESLDSSELQVADAEATLVPAFEAEATGVSDTAGLAVPVLETSLGRCLIEARKARGLSISDVAQAIKFSPRQIETIENEDFDKLPGTTFVRGFIRSYAKLLHLDPATLLSMFDKQVPQVAVTMQVLTDTGAALPQVGERNVRSVSTLLALLLLAVLVGATAYFYWPAGKMLPAATIAAAPTATVAAPPTSVEQPLASAAPVQAEAGQTRSSEKPGESAGQVSPPVDPEIRQLIFAFDDKSWVEVKDATQRIIFAQNNLPGTRQVVNGKPPFAMVIGNASRVQLLYEERQIDLQPHTKVDVARLTLE